MTAARLVRSMRGSSQHPPSSSSNCWSTVTPGANRPLSRQRKAPRESNHSAFRKEPLLPSRLVMLNLPLSKQEPQAKRLRIERERKKYFIFYFLSIFLYFFGTVCYNTRELITLKNKIIIIIMGNTACILETVPAPEVILLPENL